MKIALVEAFNGGSHATWLAGLVQNSRHKITAFTLPGRFWKWRMHGGAITLAEQLNASKLQFDAILCSEMMDLGLFKSLLQESYQKIPLFLYTGIILWRDMNG